MEDIALAVVLYTIYWCVVSLCLYNPKTATTSHASRSAEAEGITAAALREAFAASDPEPVAPPTTATPPKGKSKKGSQKKKEKVINLTQLTTLEARVACGVLDIQQKVHGSDCGLTWMRAQIERALTLYPEKRDAVYAALHQKFPHLLIPTESRDQTRNLA